MALKPSANNEQVLTGAKCSDKLTRLKLSCEEGKFDAIAELAVTQDGLILDKWRQKAWPVLLGYDPNSAHLRDRNDWKALPEHRDEDQVGLDVDRSFVYYPKNMSPRESAERKQELKRVIIEVLRRHPTLCYFQGFHDICQVFLLVLGEEQAVLAAEHIALLRIRDFMLPSLSPALDHLQLLYPLLMAMDAKLCIHISRTKPFFALAATLTLYAHEIQEYSNIARLFDAFLATDPIFPLYMFAQIIAERRQELFDVPDDEPEMLHSILSKLPKPLDLESLISKTIELIGIYPPEKLSSWARISSLSVLKTSRRQSLLSRQGDGGNSSIMLAENYLHKQTRNLEYRQKLHLIAVYMQKYKPQLAGLGLAILVGAGAMAASYYWEKV